MTAARLATRDLKVVLGGRPVVEDASLMLPAAALITLVGPNGAGKTSLLRALVGLLPSSGEILLDGVPLSGLSSRERARRIAYLPQGHEAHWPLPARDIVALGRLPHGAGDPLNLSDADAAAVAAAMRATETERFADRPVTSLSGGERARVAVARVLAVEAGLILADEPTAALDPRHQLDVMGALRREADRGATVLAVTHDLGLAARVSDLVVVMAAGRIETAAAPEGALSPGILRRVFGIEAFRASHRGQPVLVPWA